MIKQLAHTCIITQDLKKTEEFYCEGLGLEKAFVFEKDGKPYGLYLKLGQNTFLEVFSGNQAKQRSNIIHLCFEVDDIDEMADRLKEKSIPLRTKKHLGADNTWQFWIRDPNEIDIEFHQYTEKSMQKIGGIFKVNW